MKKKIAKYFALMALLVSVIMFVSNYLIIHKLQQQIFEAVSSSQKWQQEHFKSSFDSKQLRSIEQFKNALKDKANSALKRDQLVFSPLLADYSFQMARDVLKADFNSDEALKSAALFTLSNGKIQLWQHIDRNDTHSLDIGATYDKKKASWVGRSRGKAASVPAPYVESALLVQAPSIKEFPDGMVAYMPITGGETQGWLVHEYDYGPMRDKIEKENLFHQDLLTKGQEAAEKVRQESSTLLAESTRKAVVSGISAFFIAMGLALSMAFSFIARITGPIRQLTATADKLSTGTFQKTQVPATGDEVEILGKSFNDMVDAIMARDQELKKYHENLEEMLQIRTRELEDERSKTVQSSKLAALGEMAAGMAHEINNPLAIIVTTVKVIRKKLEAKGGDNGVLLTQLGTIESTSHRVAKIIKNLRSFSRDGSQDEYTSKTLDEILGNTLEFCKEKFRGHDIALEIVPNPAPVWISCNETQISQVILNLLNNAYDAIEKSTEPKWIKVEVLEEEGNAVFKIANSGKKIPVETAEKLFRPFFTTKPIGQGTGLGLSISKNIIEAHKGQIRLDMGAEHTCFEFKLPLKGQQNIAA